MFQISLILPAILLCHYFSYSAFWEPSFWTFCVPHFLLFPYPVLTWRTSVLIHSGFGVFCCCLKQGITISLKWPGTYFLDHLGLELKELPTSDSWLVGLKARDTIFHTVFEVSCSLDWLQNCWVAEAELLIFLPLVSLVLGLHACMPYPVYVVGDWTRDFMDALPTELHPYPEFFVCLVSWVFCGGF